MADDGLRHDAAVTSARPHRDPAYRKSTYCSDGDCVGVAVEQDEVRVVDTKMAESLELRFTASEWAAFVAGVKAGEFDLPASG
ncbi:hypothetical protein Acsp06_65560 [Actinomycetospora sp. NBRC 106375]|uniref:DUF397 domain-containing protein n=1 Tax=Actinomycetospora sp. NBRC 106375 TaxID=3032207 RepID=UPI0024A159EF|nr:DUF397 domain-containing protein [Actinomycetospora sp. NBRC 106375]GLZ50371.1 hypothetical protein Acsp06_65560 [Actinomycetospora sp. NBRC 106375]